MKRIFLILTAVIVALSITACTNTKAAEPGVQAITAAAEPEEKKAEPLPPEPSPEEAFKLYRRQSKKAKRGVWAGAVPTALSLLLLVTERLGLLPEEIWQQGAALRGGAWTAGAT